MNEINAGTQCVPGIAPGSYSGLHKENPGFARLALTSGFILPVRKL